MPVAYVAVHSVRYILHSVMYMAGFGIGVMVNMFFGDSVFIHMAIPEILHTYINNLWRCDVFGDMTLLYHKRCAVKAVKDRKIYRIFREKICRSFRWFS